MISVFLLALLVLQFIASNQSFIISPAYTSLRTFPHTTHTRFMTVANDAAARANRETRRANANDRVVELRKPLGITLDEDERGNVFVKNIEPNGRAAKSGVVFEGDYVTMVSATFGEDMWTCRGVGLSRVLSCIQMRNTKPVRLVLEARTLADETRIRQRIYAPVDESETLRRQRDEEVLKEALAQSDAQLLKKRKGPFGLW